MISSTLIIIILSLIWIKLDDIHKTLKNDSIVVKVRHPSEGGYQPEETFKPISKPPKQP